MKKIKQLAALELVLLFSVLFFSGCGKTSYDAERNTVFVGRDGKVVSTDVGELPASEYDRGEFKTYVEDTIAKYTAKNGEDSVKLNEIREDGDIVKVTLEYASAEDYTRFTGVELFTGSVTEALSEGYDFDVGFVNADSGQKADIREIMDQGSLSVVIIKGNVNVHVEDDIAYYTKGDNSLADSSTLSIQPESGNASTEAVQETESKGEKTTVITDDTQYVETIDAAEESSEGEDGGDDGSISDDEMLTGTEDPDPGFSFDRPQAGLTTDGENDSGMMSDTYTYLVY